MSRFVPRWSSCPVNLHPRLLQTLFRRDRPPKAVNQTAPGFTLIESLVAIIVIAITVSAITPPIFVATATRIQTRRAEQARAIAQGEVDRVRSLMERGVTNINQLPGVAGGVVASPQAFAAAQTTVPSSPMLSPVGCTGATRYPQSTPVAANALTPVDIDGDCKAEYAMQVFRLPSPTPAGEVAPFSLMMGVRVYSYTGQNYTSLSVEQSSLGLTTGRKDRGSVQRPLAVLYSQVSRNDSSRSLGQICRQSGGSDTSCQNRD